MTYMCAYSAVKGLVATFAGHLVAGIDQTSVYGVCVAVSALIHYISHWWL